MDMTFERQLSSSSGELEPSNEIKRMLETSIDITDYLDDNGDETPIEQLPSSEKYAEYAYQAEMQAVLFNDWSDRYHGSDNEYSPQDNYDYTYDNYKTVPVIKNELDEEEYEKEFSPVPCTSHHISTPPPRPTRKVDAAKALKEYMPTTKARSYKPKPNEVKADPIYRLKRARNNDAVRKSRSKAKEQQMEREKELAKMKEKLEKLEKENKALKNRLAKYEQV